MLRIMVEASRCDGCMKCVTACENHFRPDTVSDASGGETAYSACYVRKDTEGRWVPVFCRQCTEAACRTTCMSGAIRRNAENGHHTYNKEQCAACFMCVMSCPYGMPKPEPGERRSVIKCDFCEGEGIPACVMACDKEAIYVAEVDA